MDEETWGELPLAQVEDPEELKRRYRPFSSSVLRRWMTVVVGPHREAMAAILTERDRSGDGQG